MSVEETRLHHEYETAHPIIKMATDDAYRAVRARIEADGMTVANDDRAEILVVAIYRYIIDSAEFKPEPQPASNKNLTVREFIRSVENGE